MNLPTPDRVYNGRRKDAIRNNMMFYHGKSCPQCSNTIRRVNQSACVACESSKQLIRTKRPEVAQQIQKASQRRRKAMSAELKMHVRRRSDARKNNIPYTLDISDIVIPDICPVLGIPIVANQPISSDYSPSLDRFIPELGYIQGNVYVISNRANRIKNDASVEEIRLLLKWMEQHVK